MVDGLAEELGAEAAKFVSRVGSKTLQPRQPAALGFGIGGQRSAAQQPAHGIGSGVGGVDNLDMLGSDPVQYGLDKRVVGTAEQEHIGGFKFIGEGFFEINVGHLFGHRVVDPAFLYQWHKDGAGFLLCLHTARFKSVQISMAADSGFGANDDDFLVRTLAGSAICARFDYAYNRDTGRLSDLVQGQSGGCVAGDYQCLRALLLEIVGCADGIAGYGFSGLRAVGQAGGIAEVEVVGIGDEAKQSFEDSQATEAGVENADAGSARRHSRATLAVLVPESSVVRWESRHFRFQTIP